MQCQIQDAKQRKKNAEEEKKAAAKRKEEESFRWDKSLGELKKSRTDVLERRAI